jgi:hypothetical protein
MQATTLRRLESELTGGFALFDDATHTYTDEAGNVYLSGSVFCKRYSEPFPREAILPKMATKYGVKADDISAMWELKREASSSFGTGLHAALELYGKYAQLGAKTGKDGANSALHDQPIIQKVVEEFYSDRKNETAYYEPFVVDVDGKLCGQIDRLLITGEKLCRVQDFKTNADINKVNSPTTLKKPFGNMKNTNRNLYWLQLSFYAHILKKAGWTVEGLDIFHYTDKWETYSADPIDLSAVLN